jgi:hypothetical protein
VGVWEPTFITFGGLFLKFFDPLYFEGRNFLNFIPFLTIFGALDVLIRRVQILCKHKKRTFPWIYHAFYA